jgi:hypothetical protein
MSDIRQKGIAYLEAKLGKSVSGHIAVSKLYSEEESWTGKPAWWFDLSIEKIEANPEGNYYLLGEVEGGFVILRVPNNFLIESRQGFETRYQDRARLHLGTEGEERLVDQRGKGHVDFSKFEQKV